MASPASATILVADIHCGGCENAIRSALGRLDGVGDVVPDQHTNQVQLSYDDTQVTEADLRAKLADIGYDPAD